ncbi:ribonuclease J [Patescibacteria group bacterium]|nr:ribonuclease J [Patescibacteria group bacterium]MBU2036198.1 ribonuclease J [Patescibacteria group bacterium]
MNKLKFIALSGTTNVTENLYIYEYGNDIIVVDCGVGFPESDMYGVDLVIPDFSYLEENFQKVRAILISHGHEDHFGALPFLPEKIKAPIYATKLVAGFIEDKLEDYRVKGKEVIVFDPEKDVLDFGVFKVTPFRTSHSVPDGVGFAIDTPEGRIFHVPDYKFDWTPVDARPFDVSKVALLASKKPLALVSDSLGSTNPGYTESEKEIERRIEEIVRGAKKKVYFTTISSNISRMKQALNVASKLGRKVVFIGRSVERKAEIAEKLGYLSFPNNLVISIKQANKIPENQIMYIISGSYGQPGSALYRVALGEHDYLSVTKGDVVVFSSDPAPPGSKTNIDSVVDKLIEKQIEVHYYDMQEDLHVSGHGSQKDIEMLFALVRPKYLIPIGGTIRHMHAYNLIAQSMGYLEQNVFGLGAGEIVEFSQNNARISGKVHIKNVLVDGLGIGDVGKVVLRDRQVLAKEGIAIVLLQLDKYEGKLINTPEIISRGFVFEKQGKQFLGKAAGILKQRVETRRKVDAKTLREITTDFLERYFFKEIGRRPMVLPVVVEV